VARLRISHLRFYQIRTYTFGDRLCSTWIAFAATIIRSSWMLLSFVWNDKAGHFTAST
jgi:hypothetical protein